MRTPLGGCQDLSNVAPKVDTPVTPEDAWKHLYEQLNWDWEKFRREAAKDIFCAMTNPAITGNDAHYKFLAQEAIKQADELIKALKEK